MFNLSVDLLEVVSAACDVHLQIKTTQMLFRLIHKIKWCVV